MNSQLSLLDYQTLGAPHNGTDESIAAAKKAGPKQGDRKARILLHLLYCGQTGATQPELCEALNIKRQSMTAPINSLTREKRIRKLDGVTRVSSDGGECAVYVLEATPATALLAEQSRTRSGG
jgi:hypothetical protein